MATYGDPISDIAWGLAVDDASSIGLTVDRLEGSMDYEEALALWSEHTDFLQKIIITIEYFLC